MTGARFLNALASASFVVRLQWIFIGILTLALFYALHGWKSMPTQFTAHIPPDLRAGATLNIGTQPQVPSPNVYAFGLYIWQMVNRWKEDGQKNYGEQIYALQHYLTPACREQLVADMNRKATAGELTLRTRMLAEIPGQGYEDRRVTQHGNDAWTVLLDAQVMETSRGMPVKDAWIRYPLRVVRYDIDREKNPFGLAVDCFGNVRPERLDPKEIKLLSAPAAGANGMEPASLPQPQ